MRRFQLADNSEVNCREIAYVDFSITTESSPINFQAVPRFVLPEPKGDILLGKAQQEELGLTSKGFIPSVIGLLLNFR